MEKFGINQIKETLAVIITIGMAIDKARQDDDEISLGEALTISVSAIPATYKVLKNTKQLRDEYLDLDNQERAELVAWVGKEFDLANDQAEAKIEAGFEAAIAIEKFITA